MVEIRCASKLLKAYMPDWTSWSSDLTDRRQRAGRYNHQNFADYPYKASISQKVELLLANLGRVIVCTAQDANFGVERFL